MEQATVGGTVAGGMWTLDLDAAGLRRGGARAEAQPPVEVTTYAKGRLPIRYHLVAWDAALGVGYYECDLGMEAACAGRLAPALLSWPAPGRGR